MGHHGIYLYCIEQVNLESGIPSIRERSRGRLDDGNITVTNNGNIGVATYFSFAPAAGMSELSGSFTASSLTVDVGKADSTTLTLSSVTKAEFEDKELDTVSISISKYGWISQDGKTYYFDETGQMVKSSADAPNE